MNMYVWAQHQNALLLYSLFRNRRKEDKVKNEYNQI